MGTAVLPLSIDENDISPTSRGLPLEIFRVITRVMENSYVLAPLKQLEELESYYICEEWAKVKRFLLQNPDLISYLFDAVEQIYRIFDLVPLYLKLHHDPEEEWQELFIVIKSPYSPEYANKLLDKLGEVWFLDIIGKVGNRLCVTEEPL